MSLIKENNKKVLIST